MKLSLGKKIMLLIIAMAVLLSGACIVVSALVNQDTMDDEYKITADCMAATVAIFMDGDEIQPFTEKVMAAYHAADHKMSNEEWEDPAFAAYIGQFAYLMEDEDYLAIRQRIRTIQDVSEADCVYLLGLDPVDNTAIYIVDAAYGDENVPPVSFDNLDEFNYENVQDPEKGLPAFVSDTPEYGWQVSAAAPIHNSKGEVVCYAAVDFSMNEVRQVATRTQMVLTGLQLLLTAVICVLAIFLVRKHIVKPINMLTEAAGRYVSSKTTEKRHVFDSLEIKTGDEIEALLHSMVHMEADIDKYIDYLTRTQEQLISVRQKADDMHELAHMDALTGIRNKLAYDKEIERIDSEIQEGLTTFGIAMIDLNDLKAINDSYGHECGNGSIRSLSRLICDVFVHSPVFRIGGDEFAVILKNHDYQHIEELEAEFNRRMEQNSADETLQPWERISAAFGYALFDAEDDLYSDDVFKRADRNMYERKTAMKAEHQQA
ncbi:MAG: diguanylate cyclase [Oscillospiraceae bacterium]|nr:diguanylate cyclase [Oscillospiraceae bacterium]